MALTQQPLDWRPSVAEDNKAATLADTTDFILTTIRTSSGAYVNPPNIKGIVIIEATQAEAEKECHLRYDYRFTDLNWFKPDFWGGGHYTALVIGYRLDLTTVDPLSIAVAYQQASSTDPRVGGYYKIVFRGRNNGTIGQQTQANFKIGDLQKQEERNKANLPCLAGSKFCTPGQSGGMLEGFIPFNDIETAKREARALMHAALLCGGTKAVSPF
jgi:hypothetical protein